jgi:hypothetical protein
MEPVCNISLDDIFLIVIMLVFFIVLVSIYMYVKYLCCDNDW